jgi:lysozyme family protein
MTEIFTRCFQKLIVLEGGFSNHPADHGGPTNFGITKGVLTQYRGVPVTDQDIFNLDKLEAATIYELKYWNTMSLNRVRSERLAFILFATGVHAGCRVAVRLLQQTLNKDFGGRLMADGILGNGTDAALFSVPENTLCEMLIRSVQLHYAEICVSNPSQLVFLKGWLNRTFALLDARS